MLGIDQVKLAGMKHIVHFALVTFSLVDNLSPIMHVLGHIINKNNNKNI